MQPANMMVTVVLLDEWETYTEAKRREALGVVWKADLCVRIETMSTVMRSEGTAGQVINVPLGQQTASKRVLATETDSHSPLRGQTMAVTIPFLSVPCLSLVRPARDHLFS